MTRPGAGVDVKRLSELQAFIARLKRGEQPLIAAAKECVTLDPPHMIQAVFRAADAFTGSAKQCDEMTLVVMEQS
jgi:serine phosphatase RsbU (regulator of sigma subunit)